MPQGLVAGRLLYDAQVSLADELWRRIIWSKSPDGRCARCGMRKGLQAAHCFSREFKKTGLRWDVDNGQPLCPGCHREVDRDHELKREVFVRLVGEATYARLNLQRQARGRADMSLVILNLWSVADQRGLPVQQWRQEPKVLKLIEAAA